MTSRARDLIRSWVLPFVNPRQLASVALLPRFFLEMRTYRSRAHGQQVRLRDAYPCLSDRLSHTPFDPHYFYQSGWLARKLGDSRPALHVDVGSSVMTVGTISGLVPTVYLDYRPLNAQLPGLLCVAGDVTRLPIRDRSVHSLSCLHVIEHVGLGRYGDPLDPSGSQRAAAELVRVLRPAGRLYLSAPVGGERIRFNAHRVFSPYTLVALFHPLLLERFSVVDDDGRLREDATLASGERLEYGCGLFEFSLPLT